ncbi:MAG: V-type ATP synthase subunit F [Methanomassiliicoccales archaeon]|nr:V-type ATP synthase subunit F [Methanomassiliicoccales archaeon]
MEIAVIGNEEFVLGFRLAGVKRIFVAEPGKLEERLLELLENSAIGVLAIDSSSLEELSAATRRKALDSIAPVVVPVGGEEGDLRGKVKRAIGVDLYKTESE